MLPETWQKFGFFPWPHVTWVLGWSGRRRRTWHHNPPHCFDPSSSSSGWCLIISVAMTLITTWGDDVTGRKTPAKGRGGWQFSMLTAPSSSSLWIAAWTQKKEREVGQLINILNEYEDHNNHHQVMLTCQDMWSWLNYLRRAHNVSSLFMI